MSIVAIDSDPIVRIDLRLADIQAQITTQSGRLDQMLWTLRFTAGGVLAMLIKSLWS